MTKDNQAHQSLFGIWALYVLMLLIPVGMLVFIQFYGPQYRLSGPSPVSLRSVLYLLVIIGFPLTNLLRHIMLRLNQTMPGSKPAYRRYTQTVLVSLLFGQLVAGLGGMLYLKGDNFDTLVIYVLLSYLALFLYRPKQTEFQQIVNQLNSLE